MAKRYTPEWSEKIVATRRKNNSYGHTEESKDKIRLAKLGKKRDKPSPIAGRKYSILHKERIAEGHKGLVLSEETRVKIAHRPNPVKGSEHPHAALSEQQVREIFGLYARGEATQKDVAGKYKVSRGAITGIVHGYTWNHVTGLPIRGRKYKT